jgi:hypothetical protein
MEGEGASVDQSCHCHAGFHARRAERPPAEEARQTEQSDSRNHLTS